jgi:hypothetical protein
LAGQAGLTPALVAMAVIPATEQWSGLAQAASRLDANPRL